MADDAGALLVRSGLIASNALDDARTRVATGGGTIGEQLVAVGAIGDDALTDFYRSRLLVPQVNPNTLARLPIRVVAAIPSDMAIELRAIPVSLDNENNLTVAMSDPSDSHAVDEIAFFTGAYVVRAVATQMQIAWCLAHYYGHITQLGQKLLQPAEPVTVPTPMPVAAAPPPAPVERAPRTRGHTGKVEATRHRAIAPLTGPVVNVPRPHSGELDLPPPDERKRPSATPAIPPAGAAPVTPAPAPPTPVAPPASPMNDRSTSDAVPDKRTRSVSGEIRVPIRRAPSIRPPMPEPLDDDDDDDLGAIIEIVAEQPDEDQTVRKLPPRKRPVQKSNPPELAARAGEVDIATGPVRLVDLDEPRIIIDDAPPPADVSGELRIVAHRDEVPLASTTIEVSEEDTGGIIIHEQPQRDGSEPVLLDRRRPSDQPPIASDAGPVAVSSAVTTPVNPRAKSVTLDEDAEDEVVVLAEPKRKPDRPDKRTQVGIGVVPAVTARKIRDTETTAVPSELDDAPTIVKASSLLDDAVDPTRLDAHAVAPAPGDITDETVAPPPPRGVGDDTSPNVAPPPLARSQPVEITQPLVSDLETRTTAPLARLPSQDEDDSPLTAVMSAVELDEAIPDLVDVVPAHLENKKTLRIDYDPVDDGWGPPGTTIPPPLLGAIPGSEDETDDGSSIPVADPDNAPLIVAPPSPPEPARGAPGSAETGVSLVRELERATQRSIELIHKLERVFARDEVIDLMVQHLGEAHRRAGFLSIKSGDLGVFTIQPKPDVIPVTTLRLDRPSTLQDVVGTRLPYRGPMHDDTSRNFLAAVLGACPPEILLVPVAIRERVVGVLFGEHRMRHTFDDQLALAARAAGMAFERILKSKRS